MTLACEQVRPRAAGLASLPEDDAERRAAFAHAEGCRDCARALAEGTKLAELLLKAKPLEAPSPEALARASREIQAELAAESRRLRARRPGAIAAGVVVGFLVVVAMARHRAGDGRSLAAAFALAAAATLLATLAPRRHRLLIALIAGASLIFAAITGEGGSLAPGIGVHCVLAELAAAVFPLVIAFVLTRRAREVSGGGLFFATVAAAGALAGHAGLHLTCPVRFEAPHLYAFHTGGVILAAAVGFLAARLPRLLGWAAALALAGCGTHDGSLVEVYVHDVAYPADPASRPSAPPSLRLQRLQRRGRSPRGVVLHPAGDHPAELRHRALPLQVHGHPGAALRLDRRLVYLPRRW